jgi:hypothetical protein
MAEKRTIELEVKESGFKSLKAQLREAQADVAALSDKFGVTSKEATEAAKAAGILKDKIADAKDLTDAFNPDAKFNALSNSIGGVLNGFQAYEGAMGLIGVESEDLQKTLLKVQSAMALSQGIQGALEAKDSFVQLGAVVKTAFTGMTAASKAFMIGGVGLLLTGIGLLIANWDNLTASSNKAAEEQKKYAEETKKVAAESGKASQKVAEESLSFVGLVYQLKATNANSKERSNLMKEINSKYGTTLKNLSDENLFQAQLNKSVEEYITIKENEYRLSLVENKFKAILKDKIKLQGELNKYQNENNDLLKGTKINTIEELDAFQNSARIKKLYSDSSDRSFANTLSQIRRKIEAVEREDEALKKLALRQGVLNASNDELTQGGKVYVEQVEKQTKVVTDATEKINKNAIEGLLELKTIKEVDNLESLDALKKQVDAEALINKEARDKDLAADKAAAAEKVKLENELRSKKLQLAASAFDALGALAGSFSAKNETDARKQFKVQKAFSLASALTNTALAVTGALTAGGNPIKLATGMQFIEAGIAAVSGAAAVANIAKTQFNSGGGSMDSPTAPSGGGGVTAPNFNIVGNSGINQLAELGGQPIQAYVVSGEVTSAQALDRNRIQNASF